MRSALVLSAALASAAAGQAVTASSAPAPALKPLVRICPPYQLGDEQGNVINLVKGINTNAPNSPRPNLRRGELSRLQQDHRGLPVPAGQGRSRAAAPGCGASVVDPVGQLRRRPRRQGSRRWEDFEHARRSRTHLIGLWLDGVLTIPVPALPGSRRGQWRRRATLFSPRTRRRNTSGRCVRPCAWPGPGWSAWGWARPGRWPAPSCRR